MKVLGHTPESGIIIELSPREFRVFEQLQEAVAGKEWAFDPFRHHLNDEPMEIVFLCIREFAKTNFALNSLKAQIEELDSIINKPIPEYKSNEL